MIGMLNTVGIKCVYWMSAAQNSCYRDMEISPLHIEDMEISWLEWDGQSAILRSDSRSGDCVLSAPKPAPDHGQTGSYYDHHLDHSQCLLVPGMSPAVE